MGSGVKVAPVASSGLAGALRDAVLGDEREVGILEPDLRLTGLVLIAVGAAGWEVGVAREAEGDHRGAPLGGVAARARRPGRPARRIELHLHESAARVLPDEVVLTELRAGVDVGVAVRGAVDVGAGARGDRGICWIGRGLVIAQRHAEPECRT